MVLTSRGSRKALQYNSGDTVATKKQHPCGSDVWEVIRAGADFKLKCCGCGKIVMLSCEKFNKSVKPTKKQL